MSIIPSEFPLVHTFLFEGQDRQVNPYWSPQDWARRMERDEPLRGKPLSPQLGPTLMRLLEPYLIDLLAEELPAAVRQIAHAERNGRHGKI